MSECLRLALLPVCCQGGCVEGLPAVSQAQRHGQCPAPAVPGGGEGPDTAGPRPWLGGPGRTLGPYEVQVPLSPPTRRQGFHLQKLLVGPPFSSDPCPGAGPRRCCFLSWGCRTRQVRRCQSRVRWALSLCPVPWLAAVVGRCSGHPLLCLITLVPTCWGVMAECCPQTGLGVV